MKIALQRKITIKTLYKIMFPIFKKVQNESLAKFVKFKISTICKIFQYYRIKKTTEQMWIHWKCYQRCGEYIWKYHMSILIFSYNFFLAYLSFSLKSLYLVQWTLSGNFCSGNYYAARQKWYILVNIILCILIDIILITKMYILLDTRHNFVRFE